MHYGITELQTSSGCMDHDSFSFESLWTLNHCAYGPFSDKILENHNPSGKHARWWTKVYGAAIAEVHITESECRWFITLSTSWYSKWRSWRVKCKFLLLRSEIRIANKRFSPYWRRTRPWWSQCSFAKEQMKDPDLLVVTDFLDNANITSGREMSSPHGHTTITLFISRSKLCITSIPSRTIEYELLWLNTYVSRF